MKILLTVFFLFAASITGHAEKIHDLQLVDPPSFVTPGEQANITIRFSCEAQNSSPWSEIGITLLEKETTGPIQQVRRKTTVLSELSSPYTLTFENVDLSAYAASDQIELYAMVELASVGSETIKVKSEPYPIRIRTNSPPLPPTAPNPFNGARNQNIPLTLSWNPPTDPDGDSVQYVIYLGQSKQLTLRDRISKTAEPSIEITSLSQNQTYYWRVDCSDGKLIREGAVWKFTTAPQEMITNPAPPAHPGNKIYIDNPIEFSTGNASCNLPDHQMEYRFSLGDGTTSTWNRATTTIHTYTQPGEYTIQAQARCAQNPMVISPFSDATKVSVHLHESGQITGIQNQPEDFNGAPFPITLSVKNTGNDECKLAVQPRSIPKGWKIEPLSREFTVKNGSENTTDFMFILIPPTEITSTETIEWDLYFSDQTGLKKGILINTQEQTVHSKKPKENYPAASRIYPLEEKAIVQKNNPQLFSITASDRDGGLDHIEWKVDGVIIPSTSNVSFEGTNALATLTHSFTAAGPHTVQAVIYDMQGDSCEVHWSPSVNTRPSAASNIKAEKITPNSAILSWNASTDADGDTLSYLVSIPKLSRTPIETKKTSIPLTGLQPDTTYTITITAKDPNGGNASTTSRNNFCTLPRELVLSPKQPISTASTNILTGTTLTLISGDSSCSHGHSVEYSFDFGDGTSSDWTAESGVLHQFNDPGTFPVKAYARCKIHPDVKSQLSQPLLVTVGRPESAEITGILNLPDDFDGETREITFKVKNNGKDECRLTLVPRNIPQGWTVSPAYQQVLVPYGTENEHNFSFKLTPPPKTIDSHGPISWELYYCDPESESSKLLDEQTVTMISHPRTTTRIVLYKQKHNTILSTSFIALPAQ